MTTEELNDWVIDKLNSCYIVTHEQYLETYFLYYDESYVRKQKLSKLSNTECSLPTIVNGMCLFEMNVKFGYLYCDSYIFDFIDETNHYIDIDNFFDNTLANTISLSSYTAYAYPCNEYCNTKFENHLDSLTIVENFNINKKYER